jgi:hypothetical protein
MAISTAVEVTDRVSGTLNRITAALYSTTSAFAGVDIVSETAFNASGVQAMAQEVYSYEQRIQQLESDLVNANNRLEQMEEQTKRNTSAASGLESAFTKIAGVVAAIGIGSVVKDAIEYASDLAEVQNVVDVAFGDSSAIIDEWATTTSEAFGINELSAKQYAGTMGAMLKSSGLAGSAVEEMSMNVAQLAGDMASFYNLETDEAFAKIRSGLSGETEPLKQLGINMSVANLEAYALSQGIETAYSDMDQASQTLLRYNYLLSVTGDAQGDFARTSDSYANQTRLLEQNWQSFTGTLASSALPILTYGIELLNSGIGFLEDNWSVIQPILLGVIALVGTYTTALLICKAIQLSAAIATGIHTMATTAWSIATFTQTAAQSGLNAALLACPITWIIVAIIALIAAIYAIVAAVNKMTGSTYSATGIIAGAFAFLAANIVNTFVVPVQNRFASFVNFLGNVFNNPIAAIQVLFYDMALTVIGYISSMASAIETVINKIPGVTVDITSGLDNFYAGLEQAQQAVKDESGWTEYIGKMDYVDAASWANAGYDFGSGVEDKITSGLSGLTASLDTSSIDSAYTTTDANSVASSLESIAGDTSDLKDSVDISDENLKYLRDVAERDVVNRFTTAEIKVDMQNNNTISNGMDIDGVISQLTAGVQEAMEQAAEGVH